MSETDVKTEPAAVKPPDSEEFAAKLAALKADNEAVRAEARLAAEKTAELRGQLSVLTSAVNEPTVTEQAPDIVSEPEKALEYFWNKKARPILDEKDKQGAATQKEFISVKRTDDWKDYGTEVEALIAQNRISPSMLASPGAYEGLLDFVKGRHVDEIVKKKVEAELTAAKARAATSSPSVSAQTAPAPGAKSAPEPTERELFIFKKLGVDPKRAIKDSENVVDDGIRLVGEVAN